MTVEQLPKSKQAFLILQQRVPEGFSATRAEHEWHGIPNIDKVEVTDDAFDVIFAKAEGLRASGPGRNDYVYRVVVSVMTRTGWVLA